MYFTPLLSPLYALFGVEVTLTPNNGDPVATGLAMLDRPGTTVIGGEVLATDYSLRFPASTFPVVRRGDAIAVGAELFTAREAAQPIGADGAELFVPLAKA